MKCPRCGNDEDLREVLHDILEELRRIHRHRTPHNIEFKEITMLAPDPGNTLVFTGTITPDGAAFPSGTTFTATSVDPNVTVTVDAKGLVVTAAISATAVPGTVADITWSTSTFVPEPSISPASLSVVIPLTISTPVVVVPTPTSVAFTQTT